MENDNNQPSGNQELGSSSAAQDPRIEVNPQTIQRNDDSVSTPEQPNIELIQNQVNPQNIIESDSSKKKFFNE